ncbi:MAG TPA: insulinase family protein [Pyrinomonadaceae bacterium]|nr:insulinase family protein [Pyrinomonadaceae bacterium]
MRLFNLTARLTFTVLILVILTEFASAQRPGSQVPRQEKLLNGLKVLMWNDPSAPDVRVSVRVHAGSSFDPQGKEGVMRILANSIFPTPDSRQFFKEELGGSLEVITNYDYIQINGTAKSSEFLTLLETVSQAVENPSIEKETIAALKKAQLEELTVLSKDPAYVADQAAAKRLYGTFPYGRPQLGTVESLERIDFADLLFAKERLLSADNATVAISGNFNSDLGFRAARRYLGAWLKSDKKVPSTFRQPDDPDVKPLEINLPELSSTVSRRIRRGVARNDKDYFAAEVLSRLLAARSTDKGPVTVANEAFVLPGAIVVRGTSMGSVEWPKGMTEDEVSRMRASVQGDYDKRSLADKWLDADTYKLTSVTDDATTLQNIRLADVQRVAERLSKNPEVTVIVKQGS